MIAKLINTFDDNVLATVVTNSFISKDELLASLGFLFSDGSFRFYEVPGVEVGSYYHYDDLDVIFEN